MADTLRDALLRNLNELEQIDPEIRLQERYAQYRRHGKYIEVEPMLYPLTFQPIFQERVWGGLISNRCLANRCPPISASENPGKSVIAPRPAVSSPTAHSPGSLFGG